MLLMNTHIFVKRRPKCKNVGTVWSLAERMEIIEDPGSIGGVWGSRGRDSKNVEDLSSNNVAQQQHTSSDYRKQHPVEEEGSSPYAAATAAAVAVGRRRRQENRGREVARVDTNRSLPPSHLIASQAGGPKQREGEGGERREGRKLRH